MNLFKPKDWKYCLPLEIIASAKLFHVVVESKENVKPLIDSNAFWGKWTIVPLRDVRVAIPNKETITKYEQEYEVISALNAIDFHPKFQKAMIYTFGKFLICKNS